jgi:hypothetical protein
LSPSLYLYMYVSLVVDFLSYDPWSLKNLDLNIFAVFNYLKKILYGRIDVSLKIHLNHTSNK